MEMIKSTLLNFTVLCGRVDVAVVLGHDMWKSETVFSLQVQNLISKRPAD